MQITEIGRVGDVESAFQLNGPGHQPESGYELIGPWRGRAGGQIRRSVSSTHGLSLKSFGVVELHTAPGSNLRPIG